MRQLERVVARARERALTRDPEARELVPEHLEARDLDGIDPRSATGPAPKELSAASAWQEVQAERARVDERELDVLRATLLRNGNVVAHAARELGIARTTLAGRLEGLGIRARRKPAEVG